VPHHCNGRREVSVEKLTDDCFIDALNIPAATVNPLGEVGDATQAMGETVPGVAAVTQVLLEGIDIGCQRALVQPVYASGLRQSDVSHGGLLKGATNGLRRRNFV
jgi:hypothetical protein